MRLTKYYLLFAILLFCSITLHAQNKPAPFKLFFEKVYLHTDRDLYTQGDTIWYKAYLVNAQNNQLIGTSGNLYVELIKQDSARLITRQIIRIDFGTGNGDMSLSDSIPSGKYKLRAYTNWMRNFGDNFIFEKELTVLNTNPQKILPAAKNEKAVSKSEKSINIKPAAVNNTVIRFYPESGSLIEGVGSIVAVKAEDRLGKGIKASGAVLNTTGDTIAHFNCDTLGMGLFALMPLTGQKYHAQITSKIKNSLAVDMPQPLGKGFALRVAHTDSIVTVIINCNDAALGDAKGRAFTLSGKHNGKTIFNKSIQISDLQILIRISNDIFPAGITSIALADGNKPQCERLVYIDHKTSQPIIQTDKASYQNREKVTVHINTGERSNLSMAVVDAGIVPLQQESIESYLALQSELKGKIEHPERYFDTTNTNRHKQLDLLLMTHGWRDFVWRRLADSAIRISYKAEDGFDVTGRVRQKFGDKPIKDMNITLTAFKAKGQKLYSARTDSAGKYAINHLQLYGPQPLKLTARNDKGIRAGWLLMDSVNNEPLVIPYQPGIIPEAIDTTTSAAKALTKRAFDNTKSSMKNGIKLREVKITDRKTIVLQTGIPASTFGYPDQVFNITKKDEFYESLENWLAHNIQGGIINDQSGIMFYAKGRGGIILAEGGTITSVQGLVYPVMIVNGREIVPSLGRYILMSRGIYVQPNDVAHEMSDDDIIMEQAIEKPYYDLGMDKVKSVVLKHMVGQDPDYAKTIDVYVLYLTLVPGALENKDFGFETANADGYYQNRTFYKPQYDTPKSLTKPDLRTTIHWEPNINTDAKGQATVSFYNADPKTKVRVVVQGIKAAGGPVNGNYIYEVK